MKRPNRLSIQFWFEYAQPVLTSSNSSTYKSLLVGGNFTESMVDDHTNSDHLQVSALKAALKLPRL